MWQGDIVCISDVSVHFTLLFTSPAGGELLLWGQIPCGSRVSDHPGLKRLWTPQPVSLAGGKVCDWTNDVFRLLKSEADESPGIFCGIEF